MACFHLTDDVSAGRLKVSHGQNCVWAYQYRHTPKPYVHPFCTPAGEVVSLASPHDHIHHRGLMLAWRVNGVNFWEEAPAEPGEQNGVIRHEAWEALRETNDDIEIVELLSWVTVDGDTLLRERRRLFLSLEAAGTAICCRWTSEFTVAACDATISGYTPYSPISYYGLGFRFARALDIGGQHLDAEGRTGEEGDNGQPARWHYYHGRLDETATAVGVLMADSPQNPRHPTPWFQVSHPPAPFAYVTASLVAREPYELKAGETLKLDYAVWVHEGAWSQQECEAQWRAQFA